jgi:mannose-6-phosphate isomerase
MTSPPLVPILCRPVLKPKIWGGRKLESLFGIPIAPGENIGEAWMVADLAEGASTIAGGPYDGRSLSDVTREWGEAMIGSAWRDAPTGGRFPLLVKFLDAQDDLSVQVHPDHAACRTFFPGGHSKDESWIVVDAEPGGTILHGFVPGTTLENYDILLDEDRVVECLRRVEVAPGDVYRVAPGTVHALCRGVAILEIQEPSDTTFRIYDYGRLENGRPRALHLEESRKVLRFANDAPPRIEPVVRETAWGTHELLVDVPAYRIERARIRESVDWTIDPRSAQVAIVLEGTASLRAAGETLALRSGDAAILPAQIGAATLEPDNDAPVLAVFAGAGGVAMLG